MKLLLAASSASWYKWECNDITKHYLLPGLIISSYRSIRLLIDPGSSRHQIVHINSIIGQLHSIIDTINEVAASMKSWFIFSSVIPVSTHIVEGPRRAARWWLCPRVWLLATSTCEAASRGAWHPCCPRSWGSVSPGVTVTGVMLLVWSWPRVSVWSGHWAALAITSHMWDTEEAEPWDTQSSCQCRAGPGDWSSFAGLCPAQPGGEWDERPPARDGWCAGPGGDRRAITRCHPGPDISPASGHTLLSLGVRCNQASELSPAQPRRLRASVEAGLSSPGPGDTHWWHPGTGDTRDTRTGDKWEAVAGTHGAARHMRLQWHRVSITRAKLGSLWPSRHDIWGWQPQHVTKTSQRHGTNNFYLHIRTLSRKTFRHLRWLSWRKEGVTRDDGNVVVDYLPHHPDSQMGVADFPEKTPNEPCWHFNHKYPNKNTFGNSFANRCNFSNISDIFFSKPISLDSNVNSV